MGIFNRGSDDARIESLVDQARGDSVTKKRLSSISPGLNPNLDDVINDQSLIQFLEDNEQPHYCFTNRSKGITRDGVTVGDGRTKKHQSLMVVTDKRILFFTKSKTDKGIPFTKSSAGEGIPLDAIVDTEAVSGRTKHRLNIHTQNHDYTFYIKKGFSFDEIESASEYIKSQSNGDTVLSEENTKIGNLEKPWEQSLAEISSLGNIIAKEPRGDYVTEERVEKVRDILDPDEVIHFLTRGSTVDVEGSSAGPSLFGDDRSRKTGTAGWVRAAMTNKRVAVKVPQNLGDDERSVPYNNITSVDLDTGLTNKRISLQTPGQTYHIEAHDPGKEEVRDAVRFVRQKIDEANQQEVVVQQPDKSAEPDPLEQIEKLKNLKETGAISQDEFEEKKQELLDKI